MCPTMADGLHEIDPPTWHELIAQVKPCGALSLVGAMTSPAFVDVRSGGTLYGSRGCAAYPTNPWVGTMMRSTKRVVMSDVGTAYPF